MTLQEAINSGLPFKRKNSDYYFIADTDLVFSIQEILADDWEVKEKRVTLTKEALAVAIREAYHYAGHPLIEERDEEMIAELFKRLGL